MNNPQTIESEIVAAALGRPREPPVDLFQLAEEIGVIEVRSTRFRDGFTDFSFPAPVVYLNRSESSTRMRFIFAHELAHVIIRMPQTASLMRRSGRVYPLTDEEEMADRIAGAILIPDSWIETLAGMHNPLARLKNIAHLADVPLPMLVARMIRWKIDVALLHWRRGNYSWHLIDRTGAPSCLYGPVQPSAAGRWAIENLRHKESELILDCRVGDKELQIRGTAYRRGGDVWQLIEPSRDIWIVASREHMRDDTGQDLREDMTEQSVARLSSPPEPNPLTIPSHPGRHRRSGAAGAGLRFDTASAVEDSVLSQTHSGLPQPANSCGRHQREGVAVAFISRAIGTRPGRHRGDVELALQGR